MVFKTPLIKGRLIKRYKRFLADIELTGGEIVTAHCTNSGSMKSCLEEGAPVYISKVDNPARKTGFTWEMIYINGGWVGINTSVPNILAYEAILDGDIPGLNGFTTVRREVKFLDSRFDIYAENSREKCFVEVKNVTLKEGDYARFPDAVTTRGKKHLETLIKVVEQGMRGVMLYIVQREDVKMFAPAWNIDPDYSGTLVRAVRSGVEIIAITAKVTPVAITLNNLLPVVLEQ